MRSLVFVSVLIFFLVFSVEGYEIGVGIADITGPVVGVTFMGYGNLDQQGKGLHTRLWSRAFIINDGENRLVFVNIDAGMMGDGVRMEVIRELEEKYFGLYNIDNVMISATHTHSGPGGFLMHTLFDLPSWGFSEQTFHAMVSGIVKSIDKAHLNLQEGKLFLTKGEVLNANINRSPRSYEENPKEERDRYKHNVDKELTQLRFISKNGTPLGVINWFAVHATSMNNTNTLVSSDNVGYASVKFEQKMNPGKIIGKGPFVAAFASSNLGDVSPNIMGPKCQKSGKKCNVNSQCEDKKDSCYAIGPGKDMFESTQIIGDRLVEGAWKLWKQAKPMEVKGPIYSIHQYVDMPTATAEIYNKTTGKMQNVQGCRPAMGYSFAAGTIDGPFTFNNLYQGMTEHDWFTNFLRNTALAKPTEEDIACHSPKPILLPSSQLTFPFDWQPSVVSTQLATIGNIAIACVPGEFTTMSGRRMRDTVKESLKDVKEVIIAGLCNTYSDYIATYEEYQIQRFEAAATLYGPNTLALHLKQYTKLAEGIKLVQRYEGASTLYGPNTLAIHLSQFRKLAQSVSQKSYLERGPEPSNLKREKMVSLIPSVLLDTRWFYSFGDVIKEPDSRYQPGDFVSATFIAGHPRNDLKLDDTYFQIEHLNDDGHWEVVATDANWETKMLWKGCWFIFCTHELTIEWKIPEDTPYGSYRIRHFGHHKSFFYQIIPYEGVTEIFLVTSPGNFSLSKENVSKRDYFLHLIGLE